MSEHNSGMVTEAKRILDGIVSHQKNTDDRLSGFEKQVTDLKKAHRLMTEAQQAPAVPAFGGESRLRSFVGKDGKIQWTSETKSTQVPGRGTINVEKEGLLDASVPANDWHADLQQIAQKRAFARLLMSNPHTPKTDLELFRHLEKAPASMQPAIQRAFFDSAGSGAEWIPDEFRPELYESFKLPTGLKDLFPSVQVERNTILVPRLQRGGRPYAKGQISTDSPANYTASTVETAQKSVSIKGLATRYVIDDAAAEDSAIALMPTLSRQIAQDLSAGYEDCMINGDTAAVHQDDIATWNIRSRWGAAGLGGASDHRRLFDGLRRQSFARGTNQNALGPALALADILTSMGAMGELAVQDQMLICSPEFMISQLFSLTEVQTIDKYGPAATILTGQLASILGMPIIMSRFVSADMNAAGVYPNGGSTQTGFLIVNRSSYVNYERKGILIETSKDIAAGAIEMVSTLRSTFDSPDAATATNVVYTYNYNS